MQESNISTYTGGGCLFAAIDAAVVSNRIGKMEEIVKPINEQMAEFDFRKTFEKALQESEINKFLPNAKVGAVLAAFTADERRRFFEKNSEDGVLQIQIAYQLSSDYKKLLVGTTAYLWARGIDIPFFYNTYAYHTPPVNQSSDTGEIVKAWSDNKGEKLRTALAEGVSETIKMLNRDLSQQQDVVIATQTPPLWIISSQVKLTNPSYLEKNGNRYIMRAPNGALVSLSSDDAI